MSRIVICLRLLKWSYEYPGNIWAKGYNSAIMIIEKTSSRNVYTSVFSIEYFKYCSSLNVAMLFDLVSMSKSRICVDSMV